MMRLVNTLIIRSVKTADFGTKLTEDMASAKIVVNPKLTSICKLRAILIILTLAFLSEVAFTYMVSVYLTIIEALLFAQRLILVLKIISKRHLLSDWCLLLNSAAAIFSQCLANAE